MTVATYQLPDGRTLTMERQAIEGPTSYFLDGQPITEAEATQIIDGLRDVVRRSVDSPIPPDDRDR